MFNLMNKRLNKKGFTLIELIVVIAIIAILAVILIPRFTGFTDSANKSAAISNARNLAISGQALEAEGDTSPTAAEMVSYSGLTGVVAADVTTFTDYTDFVYKYVKNKRSYTVTVTNGVVQTGNVVAADVTP